MNAGSGFTKFSPNRISHELRLANPSVAEYAHSFLAMCRASGFDVESDDLYQHKLRNKLKVFKSGTPQQSFQWTDEARQLAQERFDYVHARAVLSRAHPICAHVATSGVSSLGVIASERHTLYVILCRYEMSTCATNWQNMGH